MGGGTTGIRCLAWAMYFTAKAISAMARIGKPNFVSRFKNLEII